MGFSNLRAVAVAEGRALPKSIKNFGADIKIAHSIFALPFAASAFLLGKIPIPGLDKILLLLVCMIAARTTAMGMNRFLDRHIDLSNPRTRARKIPSGELSPSQGFLWSTVAAIIFTISASALSPLAGYCSFPVLLILVSYSWMKRLTWLTHWYLGLCLGLAPLAVEVSMSGKISMPIFLIGMAVTFWAGGFDVLYALQDMDFDQKIGLHSVPSKWGARKSILISRISFAAMILCLTTSGILAGRGYVYYAGVVLVALMLLVEHWLIRDARVDGKSKYLNVAFFNVNAWVSVAFFFATLLDEWIA